MIKIIIKTLGLLADNKQKALPLLCETITFFVIQCMFNLTLPQLLIFWFYYIKPIKKWLKNAIKYLRSPLFRLVSSVVKIPGPPTLSSHSIALSSITILVALFSIPSIFLISGSVCSSKLTEFTHCLALTYSWMRKKPISDLGRAWTSLNSWVMKWWCSKLRTIWISWENCSTPKNCLVWIWLWHVLTGCLFVSLKF